MHMPDDRYTTWAWFIVALSVAAVLAAVGRSVYRSRFIPSLPARPSAEELADCELPEDAVTPEFLLTEVRSQLERRTTAAQNIDAKIAQFMTIVGGGAGVVALASRASDKPQPTPSSLVVAAGFTLLMVLVLCAWSVFPRKANDVSEIARPYNKIPFISENANKPKLAHELIERYDRLSTVMRIQVRNKRDYYAAASLLFVLALATVFASFVFK